MVSFVPIAARCEPPLSAYGQLPGFEMAAISPSGDHVAMVGTVGGVRRLIVLDAAGKLVTTQGVGSVKLVGLEWAGDFAVLVHLSNTVKLSMDYTARKAELGSVAVVPIDGKKVWSVLADDRFITGGVAKSYGVIERNGRWYGYFSGIAMDADKGNEPVLPIDNIMPSLFEVDLQTGEHHIIANKPAGDGLYLDWLVNGKGAVGASIEVVSQAGHWVVRDGRGTPIASGNDKLGHVSLIAFTPDGTGVIYATRDTKGASDHWFSVPLAGGTPQPYLDDLALAQHFEDRGHRLTGYIEDNADHHGHFVDAQKDKIYAASERAFPAERMDLQDSNDAFDRLLVTTQGPGDPITWWKVDIKTGSADVLGTSYPIAGSDVATARLVPYAAADGLKMDGVLTMPPGRDSAKGLPAVIMPHGGPFGFYDTTRFDWLAQAFASRGYAVFQPNFRGSGGHGTAFEIAGYGESGSKMQTDISDGLAELVKQGIVDPMRVCIVGWSYGGYAAQAGVTVQQGLYRCAVSMAGLSDLRMRSYELQHETNSDPMTMRTLETEFGEGRNLDEVSPIRFVGKVSVPVMLIHGKDDTVVNYDQSRRMAEALKSAGKQVEFVTLPNGDH